MINMNDWPESRQDAEEYLARKKHDPFFKKLAQDYLKKLDKRK